MAWYKAKVILPLSVREEIGVNSGSSFSIISVRSKVLVRRKAVPLKLKPNAYLEVRYF